MTQKPSADVKSPLYSVLTSVLLYNQRYFFKPSVVRSLGNPQKQEEVLNRAEFLALMEAYGRSFLQPDIAVFQQNLAALEEVNRKWRLFHKKAFTEAMTAQFLTVLLQALLARSHDLLRDEIVSCVHSMASADFAAFFEHFLPGFVQQTGEVDRSQADILKANFKPDTV